MLLLSQALLLFTRHIARAVYTPGTFSLLVIVLFMNTGIFPYCVLVHLSIRYDETIVFIVPHESNTAAILSIF